MKSIAYEFNTIISSIIKNYQKYPESEFGWQMPDKTEIIKSLELLKKVLFPKYFGTNIKSGKQDIDRQYIGELLTEIETILKKQIQLVLDLNKLPNEKVRSPSDLCRDFLFRIPYIRDTVITDVQAALSGDPAAQNIHEIIYAYPGISAIMIYRLAHELFSLSVPLIPRIMTEYAHSLTGIDIHPGAKIGKYFFIDHGTGVVIGETTEIGEKVKIYQGVTLGALSTRGGQKLRGLKRHPTIEDGVTVYSGATILGGDTVISNGCIIGGNVFITESVPPGTKVLLRDK